MGFDRVAPIGQKSLDRIRNALGQRDFNKNQGVVRYGRVEKPKAPAIRRLQASTQIVPTVNCMNSFVCNDLFQYFCRGSPNQLGANQENLG